MQRNLLLIHADELYYRDLGCMGSPTVRTPNIDALAADGCLFENAYSVNGVCVPSRASLMTGRYPCATGVVNNEHVLSPNEALMPQFFVRAGYTTGYFGKTHYGRPDSSVAADGWQESFTWHTPYNQYLQDNRIPVRYPEGPEIRVPEMRYWSVGPSRIPNEHYFENVIADRAADFIRGHAGQPFLCFVSNIAPHGPFTPPPPYDALYDPAAVDLLPRLGDDWDRPPETLRWIRQNRKYINEDECRLHAAATFGLISLVDDNVGKLVRTLKEVGVYDETLIVFTTDHGDFRSKYGIIGKSWCMDDCLLRTPLIVSHPECRDQPARTSTLVENVDVLPTLLEFAGLDGSRNIQGRSFLSTVTQPGAPHRDEVHSCQWNLIRDSGLKQTMIRRGDWKLVQSDGFKGELYNLAEDPWEARNLIDREQHRELIRDLRERMVRWYIANTGGLVDWDHTNFWEDRANFYDESRFMKANPDPPRANEPGTSR